MSTGSANAIGAAPHRLGKHADSTPLELLDAEQVNLFRQCTHPGVDLLRLAVAGQRLQPGDVVAMHDPWLGVEMRRDGHIGGGSLGSGDLLLERRITLR